METEIHKLLQGLREQDWWSRQRVITGLMSYPENKYVEFLEQGIRNHEDADIRNASMEVFRALGPRAIHSLQVLSRDSDPEVRLFAANIFCEIGDEAALPALVSLIKDHDVNVRVASAEAMGKIGDVRALAALKEALADETWVATAAINALGDIGGEEALDVLYECLQRKSYCEIAISAIEKAGNRESIKHLTSCIGRGSLGEAALKAIIRISERENVRPQPEYFIGLVPMLIGMLGSKNPDLKKHALLALCWSRDIMALPYILEAVKDEELQEYALEGLLNIGRKAVCSIVDELKNSSGFHRVTLAKILDMIGESKALLQFADDEDPEVRTEVALALGSLEMERAVRELNKMLTDPCEEVRLAAEKSASGLHKKI